MALAGHPVAGIVDFVVGGFAVARLAGGLILVLGFGTIDLLLDGRVEIGGGRAGRGKCETEAEAGRGHGGAKSNHRAVLHGCTRTAPGPGLNGSIHAKRWNGGRRSVDMQI